MLDAARRVPGSRAADYLGILRLALAGPKATVAEVLDTSSTLFRRLWGPLAVAALNTEPETASARAFWTVDHRDLRRRAGPPAGRWWRGTGSRRASSSRRYGTCGTGVRRSGSAHRLRRLELEGERVTGLAFADDAVGLGPRDSVVLAMPAPVAASLLPGLEAPQEFRGILNLHFRRNVAMQQPGFVGLVGGLAEWVFARAETVSVTVSAADRHLERDPASWRREAWRDVTRALDLPPGPPPPWRLVKEKRATFAATPRELARRPAQGTRWRNLVLAGDWTDTGLPATIEGAVRSGQRAAGLALATDGS